MASRQAIDSQPACALRVLVVENDRETRQDHVRNLRRWGYQAFVAEGEGDRLLADAIAKSRAHRCHVALVDMRLGDDDDLTDTTGLDLVPRLRPAISLIISAYGDRATVVEALTQKGAAHFVGKEEGPEKLRDAIRWVMNSKCNCGLIIDWCTSEGQAAVLAQLAPNDASIPADEPTCVLGRLYLPQPDQEMVTRLELKPVTEYYRSPQDVAPLVRSMVFVGRALGENGQWRQPEIVKFNVAKQIEAESERYRRYVSPYLPPDRSARVEDQSHAVALWDLGAVRYTNVATDDSRPLRQWYATASAPQVIEALSDLFDRTLLRWYQIPSEPKSGNVYDYYVANIVKLGPRLAAYAGTAETVALPDASVRLPNPIMWARNHRDKSSFVSRWQCITHGDLHSDNVFVDDSSSTCVIDYERSGPGYVLRDFVELEVDIRLRLLPLAAADLPLAYHLDRLLLAPETPDQALRWEEIPCRSESSRRELRKAFEAIAVLRQIAARLTDLKRMDEYYWALLMETLISVVRTDPPNWEPDSAELARRRSRLAAGLLCERLARWGAPWSPGQMTEGV